MNEIFVDTPLSAERGKRPQTRGILLDRMNKAMGRRLPITIVQGKRRPEKPVQAAKFASEASIAIRQGVPIPTHWKEYKKNENVLNSFMGSLAVSNLIFVHRWVICYLIIDHMV